MISSVTSKEEIAIHMHKETQSVLEEHLLTTEQMAHFVADGFLQFDSIVPEYFCRTAQEEMREYALPDSWPISKNIAVNFFDDIWQGTAHRQIFDLPQIRGVIQSLVGKQAIFDHHAIHLVPARTKKGPNLHQDNVYDSRDKGFDIHISFFPHAVTREMGGTMVVPGSHFHKLRRHPVARYHHIRGQKQTVCPAGTLVIWHHDLWHSARSNYSDEIRYMFKVRLKPSQRQVRCWNTSDLDIFDPDLILRKDHKWYGDDWRHVIIQRTKLWAAISGQDDFDIMGFMKKFKMDNAYF